MRNCISGRQNFSILSANYPVAARHELDPLIIQDDAVREAYGYKAQAGNASSDAAMLGGRAAMESQAGAVVSSLRGSGAVMADSGYRRKLATEPKK